MIIYAEQTRTFYNGKEYDFTISVLCSGVYNFSVRNHTTGDPVHCLTSIDIAFVNAMVGMMKGRVPHPKEPIHYYVELTKEEGEQSETA